jgi:Homeodomain-like domain
VTDVTGMVLSPASQRQRITARLRAEVIKHYDQGMSSRPVAATLGLGRTTVLKILKTAKVEVRPRGRQYSQKTWSELVPMEDAVVAFRLAQDKSKGVLRVVVEP